MTTYEPSATWDVARYPTMTYDSTGMTELPSGDWSVAGDLTVRGLVRSVELVASFGGSIADPFGNERIAFHAVGAIRRKDFELTAALEKESGGLTIARDKERCQQLGQLIGAPVISIDVDAELVRPL